MPDEPSKFFQAGKKHIWDTVAKVYEKGLMMSEKFWPCEHVTFDNQGFGLCEIPLPEKWTCCPICGAKRPPKKPPEKPPEEIELQELMEKTFSYEPEWTEKPYYFFYDFHGFRRAMLNWHRKFRDGSGCKHEWAVGIDHAKGMDTFAFICRKCNMVDVKSSKHEHIVMGHDSPAEVREMLKEICDAKK